MIVLAPADIHGEKVFPKNHVVRVKMVNEMEMKTSAILVTFRGAAVVLVQYWCGLNFIRLLVSQKIYYYLAEAIEPSTSQLKYEAVAVLLTQCRPHPLMSLRQTRTLARS